MNTPVRALRVRVAGEHVLWVHFSDGLAGTFEFGELLELGCFEFLREPRHFATVRVEPETGSLQWPGRALLHPEILHADLVARGDGVRLATPTTDARFQRFLARALTPPEGRLYPKNARRVAAAKAAWARRQCRRLDGKP